MTIEAFEPWHLCWLALQPEQAPMKPFLTYEYGCQVQRAGECFTAFAETTVIACAGVVNCWQGRAEVWSLMSEHLPLYRKGIHQAVKRFLDHKMLSMRRLELTLDPEFPRAVQWAKRLGFVYESTMPLYGPNGELQDMYVRLRKD